MGSVSHSKSRLKILLLNDREVGGGAETVFRETFRLLANYPNMFYVNRLSPKSSLWGRVMAIGGLINLSFVFRLMWAIKNIKPDVVHVHNYSYNMSPLILLALKIIKHHIEINVIYTAHDPHLVCPNTGLIRYSQIEGIKRCNKCVGSKRWANVLLFNCDRRGIVFSFLRYLRHLFYYQILHVEKAFDVIICPSDFIKSQIHLSFPEIVCKVIRNPSFLRDSRSAEIESNPVDRTKNGKVLGYFGRLQPEKGIIKYLKEEYEPSKFPKFMIYGDGKEKNKLLEIVVNRGLQNHVFIRDAVPYEKIKQVMESVDVVVVPSICFENCPLVVCDAFSLGKEVISKSVGGIPELFELIESGNREFLKASNYIDQLMRLYQQLTEGVEVASSG